MKDIFWKKFEELEYIFNMHNVQKLDTYALFYIGNYMCEMRVNNRIELTIGQMVFDADDLLNLDYNRQNVIKTIISFLENLKSEIRTDTIQGQQYLFLIERLYFMIL
jgi:hypothetical protein